MSLLFNKQSGAALFVVLVITFVELFGIPGLTLTRPQEVTAAILVIAAVLWISEWVPLFVVSFLILALELVWLFPELQAIDATVKSSIFFGSFFSNIILLFIGGFVLSSLMQKFGLDLKFAQAILQRTGGNTSLTLLGIILACAFLSMWISNTATTAMMLTIVFPLLKHIPEDNKFRIALVLSIPFACNIGGIGTPIGTPPNAIALSYLNNLDINLSFGTWILLTFPIMLFLLFFCWQLLVRLYPANDLVLRIEKRDTGGFGIKHGIAVLIFALTALGWIFGGPLGLKTGTVALFPLIAAFWLGLLDTSDFRKLPWDILYIISGGLALGVALSSSGLGAVLINSLPTEPTVILGLGVVFTAIIAIVMSNTATAGLVIPLVSSFSVESELLILMVVSLTMTCSMVMPLPVTTPPNAIAFSSRVIKTKDMILSGGIISIIGVTIVATLGPTYWKMIIG